MSKLFITKSKKSFYLSRLKEKKNNVTDLIYITKFFMDNENQLEHKILKVVINISFNKICFNKK